MLTIPGAIVISVLIICVAAVIIFAMWLFS